MASISDIRALSFAKRLGNPSAVSSLLVNLLLLALILVALGFLRVLYTTHLSMSDAAELRRQATLACIEHQKEYLAWVKQPRVESLRLVSPSEMCK